MSSRYYTVSADRRRLEFLLSLLFLFIPPEDVLKPGFRVAQSIVVVSLVSRTRKNKTRTSYCRYRVRVRGRAIEQCVAQLYRANRYDGVCENLLVHKPEKKCTNRGPKMSVLRIYFFLVSKRNGRRQNENRLPHRSTTNRRNAQCYLENRNDGVSLVKNIFILCSNKILFYRYSDYVSNIFQKTFSNTFRMLFFLYVTNNNNKQLISNFFFSNFPVKAKLYL